MAVEAPIRRFNNLLENAGHTLWHLAEGYSDVVTRGFLRETLLNGRYYLIGVWAPLVDAQDVVRAPYSTFLKTYAQRLSQKITDLVGRIP